MLYLAMSCLQGRPMGEAFSELASLGPVGIQLTPGCAPTAGFPATVARSGVRFRTHHGFTPTALRRPVWSDEGALLGSDHSVHPPALEHRRGGRFWSEVRAAGGAVEIMYPGCRLGTSDEIDRAMSWELPLAVDVSHLAIQQASIGIRRRTWRRLQRYAHIREIHVSHNDGRRDQHRPIEESTFGLGWARERAADGTPLVLEARFHRLSRGERIRQIELCGG